MLGGCAVRRRAGGTDDVDDAWDDYCDSVVGVGTPDGPVVVGPAELVGELHLPYPAAGYRAIHVSSIGFTVVSPFVTAARSGETRQEAS